MALRLAGFSAEYVKALRRSLALIRRRLHAPPGPLPQDLHAALQGILLGPRPVVDLVYGGAAGACQGPYSRSAGYRILLCEKAFSSGRLPAVLFHELVHVARGWELDAEAFENAWFSSAEGARPPTRDDWATFREDEFTGWWVRVNPRTRRVTDYADRFICTFAAPSPRRAAGRRSPPGITGAPSRRTRPG